MARIHKLHNQIKHYDWGSPDRIPDLMGVPSTGEPWAEMWMGTHPASPSMVCLPAGEVQLTEQLPFLFKLLAAEKPLSIQAHPDLAHAREGFERENKAGLSLDATSRNYKDSNHKPEIICALTPFTGMCGFRGPGQIRQLLDTFLEDAPSKKGEPSGSVREGFAPLLQALVLPGPASAVRQFLGTLFDLSPAVRQALTEYILSAKETEGCNWELMRDLARLYPGDPAVIAPLYMNVFHLEPGQAVFLKTGVLHAYVHGFGVELMANSDNVLRGGLTAKYIDVPELMKVLDFTPQEPQIIAPPVGDAESNFCFTYPSCEEFSLTVLRGGDRKQMFNTPSICIVTEGEVAIDGITLKRGESAFVSPGGPPLVLQGRYTVYIASGGMRASVPS